MDKLTAHIWCILFADDMVFVDEPRDGVNAKLETWQEVLEFKGFKISCTKTEYMAYNFSGDRYKELQLL